jgi:hypothetical protein
MSVHRASQYALVCCSSLCARCLPQRVSSPNLDPFMHLLASTSGILTIGGFRCVAAFPAEDHSMASPSGEVMAGDSVTVVCDEGYAFADGSATFSSECIDTGLGGQFDKGAPTCVVGEGGVVSITCNEGFEFDIEGIASPFLAHCVVDESGGSTVNGVEYEGILLGEDGSPVPACVPIPPDIPVTVDEVEMSSSQKGLYSECAKWR